MANWLNTAFAGLDAAAFNGVHALAQAAGGFFTPFCELYTALGYKGLFFIFLSVVLLLFRKTRKVGLAMLIAIAFGGLFTNLTIKKLVARPRPYVTSETFKGFWEFVGASVESKNSFPSGHTTTAMCAMMAMFLSCNKKWSWVCFIVAALMAFTRVYLVVHYFTDVLGGMIVGAVSGTIGFFLAKLGYKYAEKYKDKKAVNFLLNACILNLFKKKEQKEEPQE